MRTDLEKTLGPVVALLALGFASLVAQALFLREFLSLGFGNELSLGIALAFWLLGIVVGALLEGSTTGRFRPAPAMMALLTLLAALGPVELVLIRGARLLLHVPAGEIPFPSTIALAASFGLFPYGVVVGASFPAGARLLQAVWPWNERGETIAKVYILEAVGALGGGIAFTFFFLPGLLPSEILWMAATVLTAAASLIGLGHRRARVPFIVSWVICSVLIFGAVTPAPRLIESASDALRWKGTAPGIDHVLSTDSRYQHVDVGEIGGQYSLYENGQLAVSFPDPYSAEPAAHLAMAALPRWDRPRILLVGGAAAGMLPALLRYPVAGIDLVELDGTVLDAMLRHLDRVGRESLENENVRLELDDGRRFIATARSRYDLIYIALAEPSNAMLNRYFTVDFFGLCRRALTPSGVLVVAGGEGGLSHFDQASLEYAAVIRRSLKREFKAVETLPLGRVVFFASNDDALTADVAVLQQRFRERNPDPRVYGAEYFSTLVDAERAAELGRKLETRSEGRVNTDARPLAYFANLEIWEKMGGGTGATFKALRSIRNFIPGLLLLVPAAVLLAAFRRGKASRRSIDVGANAALLVAIATTGFCGMAFDLILLYGFQTVFGYLYGWLGLVVASFMAGLAIGGWSASRLLAGGRAGRFVLAADAAVGVFAAALAVLLSPAGLGALQTMPEAAARGAFLVLVVMAGVLTGVPFPLVAGALRVGPDQVGADLVGADRVGRTAAAVDSADQAGAVGGAILTGVVLVPFYGISLSLLLCAAVKLISIAGLLGARRKK